MVIAAAVTGVAGGAIPAMAGRGGFFIQRSVDHAALGRRSGPAPLHLPPLNVAGLHKQNHPATSAS
jgi:hypothetical protein